MIKDLFTPINTNSTLLSRYQTQIASYLKMKNDDVSERVMSSAFWARIRPETFLKVRPEPGP